MRRWVTVAVVLGTLIGGPKAMADPPIQESFSFDVSFELDSMSAACGVPVTVHVVGTIVIKGFVASSGTVVREIDTIPAGKITYSADTGRSVTVPFSGVSRGRYPQGATVGAPAHVVVTGQLGPFNDVPPGTGRLEFDTVILAIDDQGIPGWALTNPVRASGKFSQTARICAALTG